MSSAHIIKKSSSDNILRAWLLSRQAVIHPSLAVEEIAEMGGGKGIVATKDIPKHTTVVSIPYSCVFNVHAAKKVWAASLVPPSTSSQGVRPCSSTNEKKKESTDPVEAEEQIKKEIEKTPLSNSTADENYYYFHRFKSREIIIGALLCIRKYAENQMEEGEEGKRKRANEKNVLVDDHKKKDVGGEEEEEEGEKHQDSVVPLLVQQWIPWVTSLPPCYDNFLECSKTEITHPASPYNLLPRYQEKILLEINRWESSFQKLMQYFGEYQIFSTSSSSHGDKINNHSSTRCFHTVVTAEEFLWAYNSLMSRGFAHDEGIWAMIPWVDYFNFSNTPNLRVDDDTILSHKYKFRTTRKIQKGEQLLINYGVYTDMELALWYGFTLCRPSNHFSCSSPGNFLMKYIRKICHQETEKKTPIICCNSSKKSEEREAEEGGKEEVSSQNHKKTSAATSCLEWEEGVFMHHQAGCNYTFSPMADPDGEYPLGGEYGMWLDQLLNSPADSISLLLVDQQQNLQRTNIQYAEKGLTVNHQEEVKVLHSSTNLGQEKDDHNRQHLEEGKEGKIFACQQENSSLPVVLKVPSAQCLQQTAFSASSTSGGLCSAKISVENGPHFDWNPLLSLIVKTNHAQQTTTDPDPKNKNSSKIIMNKKKQKQSPSHHHLEYFKNIVKKEWHTIQVQMMQYLQRQQTVIPPSIHQTEAEGGAVEERKILAPQSSSFEVLVLTEPQNTFWTSIVMDSVRTLQYYAEVCTDEELASMLFC